MTAPTIYPSEAAWLASRRDSVGASEVAAVLGANPYASALSVYTAKVEGAIEPENSKMRAGKVLERGILELWAAETGAELQPLPPFARWALPDSFLSCTPDALAMRDGRLVLVQAKNVGRNNRAWDDGPPVYYQVQTAMEAAILRENGVAVEAAYLAPFFGGDDVQDLEIQPAAELEMLVRVKVKAFWQEHVIPKVPPPLDKYASSEDVRRVWRRATEGKTVEVPAEVLLKARDARDARLIHEKAEDAAFAPLYDIMKDAEVATVNGVPVFTWKNQAANIKAKDAYVQRKRVPCMLKAAEGI